jgi:hypothetical protein
MDLLPPRWVDVQDEVTEILTNVTLKSSNLDKLHQKHVLPGFDDEHIKQQQEQEIESLTQEITLGFRNCQRAIQRIEKMVKEAQMAGSLSKGDETMARNIQIGLAARVQEVSASFRKKQSNYLNSRFPALSIHYQINDSPQKCAPLEDLTHPWNGLQPGPQTITWTHPSSNLMRTSLFLNPLYNKPRRNVCAATMQ